MPHGHTYHSMNFETMNKHRKTVSLSADQRLALEVLCRRRKVEALVWKRARAFLLLDAEEDAGTVCRILDIGPTVLTEWQFAFSGAGLPEMPDQIDGPVELFSGDGAYDGEPTRDALTERFGATIEVTIPPPGNAVPSPNAAQYPTVRDRHHETRPAPHRHHHHPDLHGQCRDQDSETGGLPGEYG